MKLVKLLIVVVITAVCMSLWGCKQGNEVTGKWKNASLPEILEFKKDKTGTFTVQNNPSLRFRWKTLTDGRIELDVNFMGTTRVLYGKAEKNTFVLSGNGEQAIYNRME